MVDRTHVIATARLRDNSSAVKQARSYQELVAQRSRQPEVGASNVTYRGESPVEGRSEKARRVVREIRSRPLGRKLDVGGVDVNMSIY